MLNIKRGITPDSHKYTKNIPIATMLPPDSVSIFTHKDIPCVAPGDKVVIGQPLTQNNRAHASICGEITDINNDLITIQNDDNDQTFESCKPYSKKLSESSFEELISFIKEKGIFYNDQFLDEKITNSVNTAKVLVVSCGETTPFSCTKNKTLTEFKKEIIFGTRIVMRALSISKAAISLEAFDIKNNYLMRKLLHSNKSISLITHSSKYPIDNPSILKKAIYNKYLHSNKKIKPENILILSCEEVVALFTAFKTGLPMINKMVTIDGDVVNSPQNIVAPIGASIKRLLEFCNTNFEDMSILIKNNPVCGSELDIESYYNKDISSIIALSNKFKHTQSEQCILCKKCVSSCPMGLNPKKLLDENKIDKNCISCGACTYICPAKIDFMPIYNLMEEDHV